MNMCRFVRLGIKWPAHVIGIFFALALLLAACDTSEPTATSLADANTTSLPSLTPTGTQAQTPTAIQIPSATSSPTPPADTTPTATPATPPAAIPSRLTLQVTGQLGGQSNAVAVQGDTAYLGVGPRVLVLDISTPDLPRLLGQSDVLRGTVQDINIVNELAYVAAADAGIHILDVADPSAPREIAIAPTWADAQAVSVEGNRAYVIEERCEREICTGALSIFDSSDPSSMREIGRIETPSRAHRVAIVDEAIVLVAHDDGLFMVDVADPTQPREVAVLPLPGPAEDVLSANGYAYVASYGLRIADLSDLSKPRLLDAPATFGIPLHAVAVADDHAFVIDAFCEYGHCGSTLRALDVSDPTALREIGLLTLGDAVKDLTVRDGLAFMAAHRTGLHIADISDPTQMEIVGRFNTLGNVTSVAIAGGFAYATDGGSEGLQVIDVTEPAEPRRVGALPSLRFALDVALSDGLAYVPVWLDGFRTIDLTEPAQPREIGALDSDQIQGTPDRVALADSTATAYLVAAEDGLKILDVSDPSQPQLVGTYNPPGSLRAIATTGEHVVVTGSLGQRDQREGTLLVIDVTDPSNPTEIGSVALSIGASSTLAISGTYAYVAHADCYYFDCSGGLRVIDIADPTRPRPVGSLELPGGGFDVTVADGTFFVAAGEGGVWIVDASIPSHPRPGGVTDTPGRAHSLSVSDGLVHVADDSGGLLILQVTDASGPIHTEPPPSVLEIDGRAQRSGIGTYCWPTPLDDGSIVGICADMIGVPTTREPLPAPSSFTAQFRLPIAAPPEELSLKVYPVTAEEEMRPGPAAFRWWPYKPGTRYTLPLNQNPEIELSLNPGLYVLSLFARWEELGDVTYGFLVELKP